MVIMSVVARPGLYTMFASIANADGEPCESCSVRGPSPGRHPFRRSAHHPRWPARSSPRSTLPPCEATSPGRASWRRNAGARGGQGQRLRARAAARAPGARRGRWPGAGRARRRDRSCASDTTRGASCCSRASSTQRELPEFAQRRLATVVHDEEQVRMLEAARAGAPARGVRQGQRRHEPPGISTRTAVAASASAWRSRPSVAALRLMMHFARADEDDGIEPALAMFEAGVQGAALSAVARQLRRRRPLLRDRRRHRAAGHHALRRVAASLRDGARRSGLQPVMTLRSRAHRRSRN